jgi:lysophospholipase L1-like esterase
MNNAGVYGIRVVQALDITRRDFPLSDTIGTLAQFAVGSLNPIDMVTRQNPTLITVELGANDLLRVATYGDANLMTSVDSFQAQFTRLADRLDSTGASIAISNVPDVTVVPFLSRGLMFYCLKNGCAPLGISATAPFNLATFAPAANCAPSAFGPGGVGDSTMVGFPTTGGITKVLQQGGAVQLDCAAGTVLINVGAGFVPPPASLFPVLTITAAEYAAARTRAVAFNTFLQTLATSRGYAFVDVNAALQTLAANPANVPPFPQFSGPGPLFGPYFSLDGFHPSKAGQRLIAQAFAAAINSSFGTSITVP